MTRPYERMNLPSDTKARASILRQRCLDALGGKCVRCGFTDVRALQIDHRNGGGKNELLRVIGRAGSGYTYYKHVLKYIERYQCLCANCNWIKKFENGESGPFVICQNDISLANLKEGSDVRTE